MSRLLVQARRSTLPVLIVLCLAALTVSYAYAEGGLRPLATQIIGDPDAAVTGKLAVGTATPGNKALTVVGVIDFLGAGTVHNYFTQGAGNNMQINANVDEANTVGDATKSQWKLVMGSSLDWFSIRRSPAGATYNEDALFFINGSTGNVGIATVDTSNGASIPFTPQAKLDVETMSGDAVRGAAAATSGVTTGVYGENDSTAGRGVAGYASATTGANIGVHGRSLSSSGTGVYGHAAATTGGNYGVFGQSNSTSGSGVYGSAHASSGVNFGVVGETWSSSGYGLYSYGDVHANGDFTATGTKSAIVETESFGWRNLYAVESPQNWFEDFGQATLVRGEEIVPFESVFAETVNLDAGYHVFLTPLGQCALYVAEKSSSSFTVRALEGSDCEIAFDYRIIAPRLDYEDLRLKQAEDPQAVEASMPEVD